MFAYHIFISYSWADVDVCSDLVISLKKLENVRVWVDSDFIQPGNSVHDRISKALDVVNGIVVLITANSLRSKEVADELARANERRKHIIPVVAKGITLEDQVWHLRDLRRIDYRPDERERMIREVSDAVSRLASNELIRSRAPLTLLQKMKEGAEFVSLLDEQGHIAHPDDIIFCELRMRQTRGRVVFCVDPQMPVGRAAEFLVDRLFPHLDVEHYTWGLTYEDESEIPGWHTFATAGLHSEDVVYLLGNHRLPQVRPSRRSLL